MREACISLGALCVMLSALLLGLILFPWVQPARGTVFESAPCDKPLLESAQQVQEANLRGRCAFRIGSELFVVEGLPRNYIDYSAKRIGC